MVQTCIITWKDENVSEVPGTACGLDPTFLDESDPMILPKDLRRCSGDREKC